MKMLGRVALIAAVAILAVSGSSLAAEKGTANGKVTAVSQRTVTVAGANGTTWTFEVTPGARVVGTGASHRTRALQSNGELRTVDNFVRAGEHVSVRYEDKGGTLYLKELRVL